MAFIVRLWAGPSSCEVASGEDAGDGVGWNLHRKICTANQELLSHATAGAKLCSGCFSEFRYGLRGPFLRRLETQISNDVPYFYLIGRSE